jgi:hypothetical protein
MKKYIALLALFGLLAVNLISQTSPHSVTLTWVASPSPGVTSYNIKRSTTTGTEVTIGSVPANVLTYVDPFQLTDEGKKFFYVGTAIGPGGESLPSNEVSATIPFSVPGAPSGMAVQVK